MPGISICLLPGVLIAIRFLFLAERIFAKAAQRAYPIIRKCLKRSAGFDSVVGITDCRVIYIAAGITNISVHGKASFEFLKNFVSHPVITQDVVLLV